MSAMGSSPSQDFMRNPAKMGITTGGGGAPTGGEGHPEGFGGHYEGIFGKGLGATQGNIVAALDNIAQTDLVKKITFGIFTLSLAKALLGISLEEVSLFQQLGGAGIFSGINKISPFAPSQSGSKGR